MFYFFSTEPGVRKNCHKSIILFFLLSRIPWVGGRNITSKCVFREKFYCTYLVLGVCWWQSPDRQARVPREYAVWQTSPARPFLASLPVCRRRCIGWPGWWRRHRGQTGRLCSPSGWALSKPACRWPVSLSPAKCFIGCKAKVCTTQHFVGTRVSRLLGYTIHPSVTWSW